MKTEWKGTWRLGLDFLRGVAGFRPRMLSALALLILANGLAETLTFTSLIPLLMTLGAAPASKAGDVVTGPLERVAATVNLEGALAIFLAAMALRSVVGYLSARLSAQYVAGYLDHIRQRLYNASSRANWLYLTSSRHASDAHALTGLTENVGDALLYLTILGSAIVMALAGITTAALVAPLPTAAIIATSVVIGVPLAMLQSSAYRKGMSLIEAMGKLYQVINSRMSGIKLAKAFAVERELERDFRRVSDNCRRTSAAVGDDSARAKLLQDVAAAVTLVIFVYLSVRIFAVPSIELILLVAISARLLPLMTTVRISARSLLGMLPAYGELLQKEVAALAAAEPMAASPERIVIHSAIEIREVSFAYPGNAAGPVLQDVSLTIPARSAFAIIGISGAGKSTLADIIAGLIVPDRGAVIVDSNEVTAETRPHWRSGVAYVPQDAPLFNDTVRDNLTLGAREATDKEIWHCLEQVDAADLVRALPGGLQATVGERGVRLSGGQRQRLRLASALLRRPELLILDEATNALSPSDERAIVAGLRRLLDRMTIIVIAHRHSSIDWTDAAALINRGRVAASGATDAVLAATPQKILL